MHWKRVEEQSRNLKFESNKTNRVDSSICHRRTVINSNSDTICKPCIDVCLNSVSNHECGVNDLSNAIKSPVNAVSANNHAKKAKRHKRKRVRKQWKPTGRTFSKIGYQWIPVGHKVNQTMPTRKWMPTGRTIPLRSEHTLNRSNTDTSTASISDDSIASISDMGVSISDVGVPITVTNQVEPIISQLSSYPFLSVFNCRSFKSFCGTWTQAVPSI